MKLHVVIMTLTVLTGCTAMARNYVLTVSVSRVAIPAQMTGSIVTVLRDVMRIMIYVPRVVIHAPMTEFIVMVMRAVMK